jgi:hypothetical protein
MPRVTNEQATGFTKLNGTSTCEQCGNNNFCCTNELCTAIKVVSLDLLEARALIKEMREGYKAIREGTNDLIAKQVSALMLDKTKEYAE